MVGNFSEGSDETITVVLHKNDEDRSAEDFKGFLVQARDMMTGKPVGTFLTSKGEDAYGQTLDCGEGEANAFTHINNNAKNVVDITWKPDASMAMVKRNT